MAKVDIIIPIYNAGKYIEATIASIKQQDYSEWNLLLIDDCSTDNTSKVCTSIAESDSRIVYVRLSHNGGPSVARNVGIDHSTAEYISFIDSDDTIETNFLSRLVATADEYKADVVWCNFYEETKNEVKRRTHNLPQEPLDTKLSMSFFLDGRMGLGCLWNKIYRRSFIEEHNCRLNPNRTHGEDWQFNMDVFRCGAKIVPIPDILYHYIRQNANSVIASYRPFDYETYAYSMELKESVAREFGIEYDKEQANSKHLYMVIDLLHRLVKSNYKTKRNEFRRIITDERFCGMLLSGVYSTDVLPIRYKMYFIFIKCKMYKLAYLAMNLL